MRALTLHQPHAYLLASGIKVIETRTWQNPYRGMVLIHAGKDPKKYDNHLHGSWPAGPARIHGAIIGYCYIYEIFEFTSYDHFVDLKMHHLCRPTKDYWKPDPKLYGWRMQGAYMLPDPIPCRGMQKLWTPRAELIEKIRNKMKGIDR